MSDTTLMQLNAERCKTYEQQGARERMIRTLVGRKPGLVRQVCERLGTALAALGQMLMKQAERRADRMQA